jgi:hypothetical protein
VHVHESRRDVSPVQIDDLLARTRWAAGRRDGPDPAVADHDVDVSADGSVPYIDNIAVRQNEGDRILGLGGGGKPHRRCQRDGHVKSSLPTTTGEDRHTGSVLELQGDASAEGSRRRR